MHCPFCNFAETKVLDSRLVQEGKQVRRRRECERCSERFTTYESAELAMPKIIKTNGIREFFNENKLLAGLHKALEKRPVSVAAISEIVDRIKHKLRSLGEREVTSKVVGEVVMEQLKALDHIAYVRFASVYRNFQDIEAFRKALDHLEKK